MKKSLLLIIGLLLITIMSFGRSVNHNDFMSIKEAKENSTLIERHRVWLNFTNDQGGFKQTMIGYVTGATNGVDDSYDGPSNTQNAYVDFYSLIGSAKFVIQGRALPFSINDEVPLGYKTVVNGIFTIAIEKADGILASQDIFLSDKTTGTFHNLKTGPYNFTTLAGTFNDRFVLVYIDKTVVVTPPVVVISPVVVDPIVPEPVIVSPVVEEVVVANPIVETPVVVDPIIPEPVIVSPVVEEVVVINPIVETPVVADPIIPEPVIVSPIVEEVVVINPIVETPVVSEPIISEPIIVSPIVEEVVVANPIVETPVVADPIIPEPIIVSPVVEEVVVANPIVETPVVSEPIISEPVIVSPIVEEVVVINPIVETPVVAEPIITEPVIVSPIVEEVVVINPVVETPVVVEPILPEPVIVLPIVEEIVVVNPVVETPVVTQPITYEINNNSSTFGVRNHPGNKLKSVAVYSNNHEIKVNASNEKIDKVMVYNLAGRQLYEVGGINNSEFVISSLNSNNQFLVVRTLLKNGKGFINKIVF